MGRQYRVRGVLYKRRLKLVVQAERLESFDENPSPHLSPTKKRSKNERLDRLKLRFAGKSVRHIVGLVETPAGHLPPLPGCSPRKRAKTGISGIFGGLSLGNEGRHRAGVSFTPTISLSSDPKFKVVQTLVLRPFFSRGKAW